MEMRKHQNKAHVSPKTPLVNRVTHACRDGYRFQTLKKHSQTHFFKRKKKNRRGFLYKERGTQINTEGDSLILWI